MGTFASYLVNNKWGESNSLWLEKINIFNLHGSISLFYTNSFQKMGCFLKKRLTQAYDN